jgi:NAD+ diphosphatase
MIGCIAEVDDDRFVVDHDELESVRWFSRDEARLLIKGTHPDGFCPPPFAIAHQILRSWVDEN